MKLLQKQRRAEKRAYWLKQIRAWEKSGITQKEFCDRHDIKLGNFTKWRQRLKKAH